ncbi:hypothetical protein BRADI_4g23222v3 [Brachypodium distachyon]|uniref:Uncharacterized protein n=1 Tax=Brachypodium distachyon TaxID=15368 RepID=A0A0Q3IS84_BRADI|nr:hypothetical protein BRADI_4g23222v3 [Brachypodium distachyon]
MNQEWTMKIGNRDGTTELSLCLVSCATILVNLVGRAHIEGLLISDRTTAA